MNLDYIFQLTSHEKLRQDVRVVGSEKINHCKNVCTCFGSCLVGLFSARLEFSKTISVSIFCVVYHSINFCQLSVKFLQKFEFLLSFVSADSGGYKISRKNKSESSFKNFCIEEIN